MIGITILINSVYRFAIIRYAIAAGILAVFIWEKNAIIGLFMSMKKKD